MPAIICSWNVKERVHFENQGAVGSDSSFTYIRTKWQRLLFALHTNTKKEVLNCSSKEISCKLFLFGLGHRLNYKITTCRKLVSAFVITRKGKNRTKTFVPYNESKIQLLKRRNFIIKMICEVWKNNFSYYKYSSSLTSKLLNKSHSILE